MSLKLLRWVVPFLCLTTTVAQAQINIKCLQDLTIRIARGGTELIHCVGDEKIDTVKFRPSTLATPIYYLVTEEDLTIRAASLKPTIDFEALDPGAYRVYALSFVGRSYVEVGMNAGTDVLASTCYELSQNYIPVINIDPDARRVSTVDGATAALTCTGDGKADRIDFATTSPDPFYAYLITDENNIIQAVSRESSFDFEGGPPATLRVWGLSFVGELLAAPGQDATAVPLAEQCYDLSDNFIEVTKTIPDGGTVALAGGGEQALVCSGDGQPDILRFAADSESPAPYTFLLTDADNRILEVLETDSRDFDGLPAGVCRVWGLSYTGNLTAAPGDDAAAAMLSDDCYALSGNFIEITKKDPQGGHVVLENGGSDTTLCVSDGSPDLLTFSNTGTENEQYVYALTDEENFILRLDDDGIIDFEGSPAGASRVWGIAYTGELTIEAGQILTDGPYSDECSERSTDFVTITGIALDGGTVSSDGREALTFCIDEGAPEALEFSVEGAGNAGAFGYLLTDDNNRIVDFSAEGIIDFNTLPAAEYRVWGLNYTGELIVEAGQDAGQAVLSTECYDLSGNFVAVSATLVSGGRVALEDGSTATTQCLYEEGATARLIVTTTSTSAESYVYLITDENNTIEFISGDPTIILEGSADRRIWGLSYAGALLVGPGDNAASDSLATSCFQLSDNFIAVQTRIVNGGIIALSEGGEQVTSCPGDAVSDRLSFTVSGATGAESALLLTDAANIILEVSNEPSIDVGNRAAGEYRVWHLSYTGALTAAPGEEADSALLSDECFDLSDNFVAVRRFIPEAGAVAIEGGDGQQICLSDGRPDTLRATTTSNTPEYLFVLVRLEDYQVVQVSEDGTFVFPEEAPGQRDDYQQALALLGIAHAGDLVIEAGATLAPGFEDALSCVEVTGDYAANLSTLYLHAPPLRTAAGSQAATICLSDRANSLLQPDPGAFVADTYYYLITDLEDRLLATARENVDFAGFDGGAYRVYGLAGGGTLPAGFEIGQPLPAAPAAGSCYDLSDNALAVEVEDVRVGPISLADGADRDTAYVGDGQPDVFEFDAPGAPATDFRYLITDESDRVLTIVEGDRFDFDPTPPGVCRVWGLAFTGELLVAEGDSLSEAVLSSGCYDLSSNFITILRQSLLGGLVTLVDGGTTTELCAVDEVPDLVEVQNSGLSTASYTYLVTDPDNIIVRISEAPAIDFTGLAPGAYRIWGLAYDGNLMAEVGNDVDQDPLSDAFFNLSDNFVTVNSPAIAGGTIRFSSGAPPLVCAGDDIPDAFGVQADGNAGAYTFLLVEQNSGLIVDRSEEGAFTRTEWNRGEAPAIVGVASAVPLEAAPGTPFSELTDGQTNVGTCFELSNRLDIELTFEIGGILSFEDGSSAQTVCIGDGLPDALIFQPANSAFTNYAFLITDANNVVRDIVAGPPPGRYDFDTTQPGIDRIWGVAYSGTLTIAPGDNAATLPLSDGCYARSDNFLSVAKRFVAGGTVAISGGAQQGTACVGDGTPDVFEFVSATASTAAYAFIVTDENDDILVVLAGTRINFDVAPVGACRVYGVSYTGTLTNEINVGIRDIALSDECYDLSDNFVRIAKEQAIGGAIQLADGGEAAFTCPDDGNPDPVVVASDGSSTGNYVYLLTDASNRIIAVTEQPVVDFEGAAPGVYRLWGLAYTGNLLAAPGDDAAASILSDGCYQLTGNFVTVVHETPQGGTVSLPDGSTEQLSCPSAAVPPVLEFVNEGAMADAYTYLITDPDNIIQAVPEGSRFDFSTLPNGSYRVWGLGYSGALLAMPGDDAGSAVLSDNCYALSNNFISVVNQEPAGGAVATEDGAGEVFTCPGDGNTDIVRFDSSGVAGRYAYLITDVNNVILSVVETDRFDFEGALPAVCRVWGLAYIGELLAEVGQDAAVAPLASDCFELSANFIRVVRAVPEGGAIAVQEPEDEFAFCAGDGRPDLMTFSRSGASPTPYYYLLTDEANRLITWARTDSIDLDTTGGGTARIWGLAFTGAPLLVPGDIVTETVLSDDCYDLSDNYIFVERTGVDGATLSSNLGPGPLYVCRGDGVDDVLTFSNNSSAAAAQYAYAITNIDNTILRIVEGAEQNFENLGLPELRIWGISYTGTLTAGAGQNIESDELSDACYALSDNHITVLLDQPAGGLVQTTGGATDRTLCLGIDDPLLRFENNSSTRLGYRYLLTDVANTILEVLEADSLDFRTLPNGNYRLWGLSYSSPLLAAPGMDAAADILSGSCYELSANFITVRKGGPIDGGAISTSAGDTSLVTCPQNGIPDLVVLTTTSSAGAPSSYRYLITDTDDRILIPDVEGNVIDFDGAAPGVYRIYGLSYTGTFMASFGQDIFASVLSDECYELSDNFVTIEHQGPQGGQIATTDGRTGAFATAACGGEADDLLAFTDNGSATGGDGYAVLVSRRDTILAVLEAEAAFDFSTLPCGNDYLVRGLAYSGALPDLVGATIGDLTGGALLDGCFDFSDNQITLTQPEEGLQGGAGEQGLEAGQQISELRLSPVPARRQLQVRFELHLPAPQRGELLVIDGAGKIQQRLTVGVQNGDNLLMIDVSQLPEGLFFLQLRAGQAMRYQRFVKVR